MRNYKGYLPTFLYLDEKGSARVVQLNYVIATNERAAERFIDDLGFFEGYKVVEKSLQEVPVEALAGEDTYNFVK